MINKKIFVIALAAIACTTAFGYRGGYHGAHRAPMHHHGGHTRHHHHAWAAGIGGFAAGAFLGSLATRTYYSTPVYAEPVYTTPVYTTPVVTTPVVTTPVYTTPVVTAPVYTTPVVTAPVVYRTW